VSVERPFYEPGETEAAIKSEGRAADEVMAYFCQVRLGV